MSFMSTRIQLSSLKYNSWKEKAGGGGGGNSTFSSKSADGRRKQQCSNILAKRAMIHNDQKPNFAEPRNSIQVHI